MQKEKAHLLRFLLLIQQCNIHALRIQMAQEHLAPILPLEPAMIDNLSDEQLGFMEMLLNRFSKLQDVLGTKIFPQLLQYIEQESSQDLPFLDVLHKMEKMNMLPSTKWWL